MTVDTTEFAELERSARDPAGPGDRVVVPGWERQQWSTLLSYARPVELKAGEVLIQPLKDDRALYFVMSGRLEVASTSEGGASVSPLASVPAGSVVGEVAFFDGGPRSAKAWAVAPARLLRLTLEDYEHYASEHPSDAPAFLFAMARLLAFRVRRLTARL
jgi:CRP-like cAMP-binding protein